MMRDKTEITPRQQPSSLFPFFFKVITSSLKPHLTIKPTLLSTHQATNPPHIPIISSAFYCQLAAGKHCEVFHIHLGLILAVISVQCVTTGTTAKDCHQSLRCVFDDPHMGILHC